MLSRESSEHCFRGIRKIAKSDSQSRHNWLPCLSVWALVRTSARNNWAHTRRIFIKFWYLSIFRNYVEKIQALLYNNNGQFYMKKTI